MSTTLHLLALSEDLAPIYLAAQKAEADYWKLVGGAFGELDPATFAKVDEAYQQTNDEWYAARVNLGRGEQLPILEASHRDTELCELTALFAASENFTLTVSDGNIQEIADAWEDSNRKRTFSLGRGKGTVIGWLQDHRGQLITLGS